jgi:hypothetical protein
MQVRGMDLYVEGEHHGKQFESATSRVRQRNIGKFRKIVRLPPEVDFDRIQYGI